MHIKTTKDPKERRARWLMELENYDYDIEYIPGKTNSIADALSRSVSAVSLQLDVDISKSQSQDPETMKIIENIKNLQPSTYQIVNGIVFHLGRNGTVPYIPKQLRTTVLEYAHDIIGHQGYSKTLNFLRKRCYWPNMSDDLDLYTKDCLSCISNKYKNFTPKASLQPMTPSNRFSFWEVDFIGPLPLTDDGNKYIIIFIDTYSKWVEAEAIPDQTALTAANALIKCVVSRFGIPDHLHSDKGTQFESEIFQNLSETLNIKKSATTPYHPMGNGGVERVNRSLKEILRHYVSPERNDWDRMILLALLALRTFPYTSTKYSPALIVYGSELKIPIDFITKGGHNEPHPDYKATQVEVKNIQKYLHCIFEKVKHNIDRSSANFKKYYDRKLME
ncbi:Transposon Tf2-9 polyprotein [Thelohanellus kitauei]|uniref:Transposon Tf2-9 polyprotein n=1 Tax=Thelohanellus kitauei TaxID=669202 RepID=A0A0C2N670_THEKT|nr:Transposon Tf2-9 polyprotein [Thelohanellus kitauei]